MAENRTINIDIKQNAEEAAKGFNKLNASLDETNKSVRDVNATFEQVYGELQPLTTRLGEAEDRLYELAAAGQQTSQEYKDLLETVANYRRIQIQTDAVVDAASVRFDEKLGGALQGAASGFAGVQGAMALFGDESEELEKTLVKLQGAMALAEGVRGVREGIKSFQALGTTVQGVFKGMTAASKAFAIGGIGLLVTGVSYLMGAFDSATDSVRDFTKAQNQSNNIQQKAIEAAAEELSALDKLQKTINDETISREAKNKAVSELQNKYPDLLKNVNAEKLSIEDLNKAIALNIKLAEARARVSAAESLRAEKYQELLKNEIELNKEREKREAIVELQKANRANEIESSEVSRNYRELQRAERRQKALQEEISQIDGLTKADQKLLEQVENKAKVYEDTEKKTEKAVKTTAKEVANYSRQLEKERIDAMEDGMDKRIKLLEFELQGELSGIDKNGKKAGELRKAIEDRYGKEIQKVKDEFRDRSDRDDEIVLEKKVATRLEIGKQEIDAEEYIGNEIYKLKLAQKEKEDELEEEAAAKRKALIEGTVQVTLQGLDLISSIAEANAGKDEKRQRAAFNIRKASNIAQATVDGYKAVLSTYADTPGGVIIKGIAATLAGAFAALKISQIAKSRYASGSSSGGGGDLASGVTTSAPQFNTIGSSGINQLAQLQQQPVQAYVVSGEVTSAQALDRNRIQNATL